MGIFFNRQYFKVFFLCENRYASQSFFKKVENIKIDYENTVSKTGRRIKLKNLRIDPWKCNI